MFGLKEFIAKKLKATDKAKNEPDNVKKSVVQDSQARVAKNNRQDNISLGSYGAALSIDKEKLTNLYLTSITGYTGYNSQSSEDIRNFFRIICENPLVNQAAKNLVTKILLPEQSCSGVGVDFRLEYKNLKKIRTDIASKDNTIDLTKEKEYIVRVIDEIYKAQIKEICILSGEKANAYAALEHSIVTMALEGVSYLIWLEEEDIFIHRKKQDLYYGAFDVKKVGLSELDYICRGDGTIKKRITGEIVKYLFKSEEASIVLTFSPELVVVMGFRAKHNNLVYQPFYLDALDGIIAISKIKSSLSSRADRDAKVHFVASPDQVSTIDVSQGVAEEFVSNLKNFMEVADKNSATFCMGSDVPLRITPLNPNATSEGVEMLQFLYATVAIALGSTYAELSGDASRGNFASEQAQQQLLTDRIEGIQLILSTALRKFVDIIIKKRVVKAILQRSQESEDAGFIEIFSQFNIDYDLLFAKLKSLEPLKDQEGLIRLYQAGLLSNESAMRELGYDPDEEIPRIDRTKEKELERTQAYSQNGEQPKRPYVKSGLFVGKANSKSKNQ